MNAERFVVCAPVGYLLVTAAGIGWMSPSRNLSSPFVTLSIGALGNLSVGQSRQSR